MIITLPKIVTVERCRESIQLGVNNVDSWKLLGWGGSTQIGSCSYSIEPIFQTVPGESRTRIIFSVGINGLMALNGCPW